MWLEAGILVLGLLAGYALGRALGRRSATVAELKKLASFVGELERRAEAIQKKLEEISGALAPMGRAVESIEGTTTTALNKLNEALAKIDTVRRHFYEIEVELRKNKIDCNDLMKKYADLVKVHEELKKRYELLAQENEGLWKRIYELSRGAMG